MMKKISVIVPVYNIEQYIGACIESIIGQVYKNLQIILVDDGSTDTSGKICDAYKEKDNRIIVIHQRNEGLSAARNKGMSLAEGELLGFVDGDDIIHPQMYEQLQKSMEINQADIVECCVKDIYDNTKMAFPSIKSQDEIITSGEEALKRLLSVKWKEPYPRYAVWSKLYKREVVENEKFPVGSIHEDVCFDTKIFLKAKCYVVLKEELYFYRKRRNSITNTAFSNRDLDKLIQMEEAMEFLKKEDKKEFAELAKTKYYMTKLLYYVKAIDNSNREIAEKMREDLLLNKEYVLKMEVPYRYKAEYHIFYRTPHFYYMIYLFKKKLHSLMKR